MKDKTISHIGRDIQHNYSYEGIRWLAFMEKYTGQNITHARNGGESVLKLMNKRGYPDGYAQVPEKQNKAIKEDFITKTQLDMDEGLKARNEKKQTDIESKGHVTKKRIVYLFRGCIWHGIRPARTESWNMEGFPVLIGVK